jgi:hypothetical protein
MAKLRRAPTSPEEATARKLAELDRRLRNRDRVTTEAWHEVGAAGEPAFVGAWANLGFGVNESAAFLKDPNGFVWLKGVVSGGAYPSLIFTLPAGYRATGNVYFALPSNGAFGWLSVDNAGSVYAQGGAAWIALDGVRFRARG